MHAPTQRQIAAAVRSLDVLTIGVPPFICEEDDSYASAGEDGGGRARRNGGGRASDVSDM